MRIAGKLTSSLFIVIMISACFTASNPVYKNNYYTLEYNSPEFKNFSPIPVIVRMHNFSASPHYNTNKIIFRENEFKRSAYNYHRWHVRPGKLVTHFLKRDLQQSGLFKAVIPEGSGIPETHFIEGSVEEFYELDEKDSWKAVLTVIITLRLSKEHDITQSILFQKSYTVRENCLEKKPAAFIESMSRAMSKLSKAIISDVYDYTSRNL